MALSDTVTIQGGVDVAGAYIRVTGARVGCNEVDGVKVWFLVYDCDVYKDIASRDAGITLPCPDIQHFKTGYSLDAEDNPIALSYTHLKTLRPNAVDC